jgi:hypothetical protein
MHCARHHQAMKRTKPCPEIYEVPVAALRAVFYWNLPLDQLSRKLHCPHCSGPVSLEWIVPEPPGPEPAGDDPRELASLERLRRTG